MASIAENKIIVSPFQRRLEDFPKIPVHQIVFQTVRDHLETKGDKQWLTDCITGESVLYSEIEPRALRYGAILSDLGLKAGDVIFFCTYNMTDLEVLMLGTWVCNAAVRGGCPEDTADDLYHFMKDAKSKMIICDPDTEKKVKTAAKKLEWDTQLLSFGPVEGATNIKELLNKPGTVSPPKDVTYNLEDDVIYIPSTGGSTGLPKGVLHTHKSISFFLRASDTLVDNKETLISVSRNYHVGGGLLALWCAMLHVHNCTIQRYSNEVFLKATKKYKPQALMGFPHMLTWMANDPNVTTTDLEPIDSIMSGGAILDQAVQRALKNKFPNIKHIYRMYGMTEIGLVTTTFISQNDRKKIRNNIPYDMSDKYPMCQGVLTAFVEAKVVDPSTGNDLGPNETGELLFRTPGTMKGYLNRPEATKETIEEDGWVHTGDLGYYDELEIFYIQDRLKETFKYKMQHVSPSELEGILRQHPEVADVGVTGVPDKEVGCLPRAYVVKRTGSSASEEDIRKFCDDQTPYYKQLYGGVLFVDKLPATGTDKLDRAQLRKWAEKTEL